MPVAAKAGLLDASTEATHLSKETWMVLVKQDAVVVLATSITATTRVLAVLANATVAGTDVTTLLAVLPEPCTQQHHCGRAFHRLLYVHGAPGGAGEDRSTTCKVTSKY